MDNLSRIKTKLRSTLPESIDRVFEDLADVLIEGTEKHNTFLIIFTEYKRYRRGIQQGTIDEFDNHGKKTWNRITYQLLAFVDDLIDDDLLKESKKANEAKDINEYIENLKDQNPDISYDFGTVFSELIQKCEEKQGVPLSLPIGFESIDQVMTGLSVQSLTVISSEDAIIARAFILNSIIKIGADFNKSVLYISMHHRNIIIVDELVSIYLGRYKPLLKSWLIEGFQWQEIYKAKEAISDMPIFFVDSINDIKAIESTVIGKLLESPIDLIVIDNLQFLKEKDKIDEVLAELKKIAKRVHAPIVLLNEIDYQGMDFGPIVSSKFKDFIYVDNSITIDVPRMRNQIEDRDGHSLLNVANILIEKNERGIASECRLKFVLDTKVFSDHNTGQINYEQLQSESSRNTDDEVIPF